MLGTKVNFKKAKIPLSKKILGDYVVLEPINPTKHVTQLFNNFYQDKKNTIWNYLPYGPFKNIKDFKKWLLNSCMDKDPFFLCYLCKKT